MADAFDGLNLRQVKFLLAYLETGVGKEAAIRAGYSEVSAEQQSSRLLADEKICEALGALRARLIERTEMTVDRLILELGRILTADIGDAIDDVGAFLPLKQWPEDVRRALSGLDVSEVWDTDYNDERPRRVQVGELKKARFWSKTDAADKLAKVLGFYAPKKVERTTDATLTIRDLREADTEQLLKIVGPRLRAQVTGEVVDAELEGEDDED